MTALVAFGLFANAQAPDFSVNSPEEQALMREFQVMDALNFLFTVGTIVLPVVAALFGQETFLEESNSGVAAWILSKPISRAAYVLAKAAAHSLSILATMLVFPGALTYLLFWLARLDLAWWSISAAMGLIFLNLLFFLCLAILLGAVIHSRLAGLGIALALNFGCHFFLRYLPWSMYVMPWGMIYENETGAPPQMVALAIGQPLTNLPAVVFTVVWIVVLLNLTVWHLQREEL